MNRLSNSNAAPAVNNAAPTFGRYKELPLEEMTPQQRHGYEYVIRERGVCPGPYKIWVENAPLMELMVPLGAYYRKQSSLNDAEREIATVLILAKWRSAFALSEHEWIAEGTGGYSHAAIPPDTVQRMMSGLQISFDDPRQQVIYEVSAALINSHYIAAGLHQRAVKLLGNNGVTDLTVLIGYFTMVALTLNIYDVPSFAEGLKR